MVPHNEASLLGLPRELRNLIYEHLDTTEDLGLVDIPLQPRLAVFHSPTPNMLVINIQIHDEYQEHIWLSLPGRLELTYRFSRSPSNPPIPMTGPHVKSCKHIYRVNITVDWMAVFWNAASGKLGQSQMQYWRRGINVALQDYQLAWSPSIQLVEDITAAIEALQHIAHPQARIRVDIDITGYPMDGNRVLIFPQFWPVIENMDPAILSLSRLFWFRHTAPQNVQIKLIARTPL